MITLQFNLRIPGSNRFKNIRYYHGSLPIPFKFWELQLYFSADIVEVAVDITARQSHSGSRLSLGLAGITVEFTIYDSRHWDTGKRHSHTQKHHC